MGQGLDAALVLDVCAVKRWPRDTSHGPVVAAGTDSEPVDVLVVEDHTLVREGLCLLLKGMGMFQHCFEAASLAEGRQRLSESTDIGLVLLDLGLPDATGLEALDGVLALAPSARVVVCSGDHEPSAIRMSFARGARGYLTKNASAASMQSALEMVLRGERYVPPEVLDAEVMGSGAAASPVDKELTPRQRDVLHLLATGLANKEIAAKLGTSPATVRAHLSAIFRVLGVENRTQAATAEVAVALVAERGSRS
jgi:two-component system nitrate/nitrite response regulator NarL